MNLGLAERNAVRVNAAATLARVGSPVTSRGLLQPTKSGRGEASAAGLVSSTTSGRDRLEIEIDRFAVRAKRLKKNVITGARLHVQEAQAQGLRGRWVFLTTTYRPGVDACPRDMSRLLKFVRRYFSAACRRAYGANRLRLRYLWVLELTKNLRPHYHVLFWLPLKVKLPKPDLMGWWPQGMTNIKVAKYAVGYLAKYASKFCAEAAAFLPKGFRTNGAGGHNEESKRELRWWRAPLEARENLGVVADIRKALGGYADKLTGTFWPSPWKVFFTPDGRTFAWRFA